MYSLYEYFWLSLGCSLESDYCYERHISTRLELVMAGGDAICELYKAKSRTQIADGKTLWGK